MINHRHWLKSEYQACYTPTEVQINLRRDGRGYFIVQVSLTPFGDQSHGVSVTSFGMPGLVRWIPGHALFKLVFGKAAVYPATLDGKPAEQFERFNG